MTKVKTLHLVRAPEYHGRPEKFIADEICKGLEQKFKNNKSIKLKHYSTDTKEFDGVNIYGNTLEHFRKISNKLFTNPGDAIFWFDGSFCPILPMFTKDFGYHDVKHFGIWHSSPYVDGDIFNGTNQAIINYDAFAVENMSGCFVATEYMRSKMYGNKENVFVSGLPIPEDCFISEKIKNSVVFNHRWADDKHKEEFIKLAESNPDYTFYVTTNGKLKLEHPNIKLIINNSREEYLENLSKMEYAFSFPILETFGYSTIESVLSNCKMLISPHPVYKELYEGSFIDFTKEYKIEDASYMSCKEDNTIENIYKKIIELWD